MGYPSDQEIRSLLRPYKRGLWLLSLALVVGGVWLEFQGLLPNAIVRSGALVIMAALGLYFYLEINDFKTGNSAHNMDSGFHSVPKGVVGPTVTIVTIIGYVANTFGDLVFPLFTCGALKC